MRITTVIAIVVVACMAAACSGNKPRAQPTSPPATALATSPSSPTPTAACSPSGSKLEIEAEEFKFNTRCLAAPADTAFTIKFKNKDIAQHNIVIEDGDQFFDGDPVAGQTTTYHVKSIPAGIYKFYCKFHPAQMNGQFVVQ